MKSMRWPAVAVLTYLPIAGHHPDATPQLEPFAGTAEIDQYRNALHYGDVGFSNQTSSRSPEASGFRSGFVLIRRKVLLGRRLLTGFEGPLLFRDR